jgi:hypothetical protein
MTDVPEYPESFANYPRSLDDIKSDRSGSARDWKPRDALISMLRRIDSGDLTNLKTAVVIIQCNTDDGLGRTAYLSASPSYSETLGAMEIAKFFMWRDANS